MFERIKEGAQPIGMTSRLMAATRPSLRHILFLSLSILAVLSLAWWGYTSVTILADAHRLQTMTVSAIQPDVKKKPTAPVPAASPADVQSSTMIVGNDATTKLRVNGQNITVPVNGSVHKTIKDNDGNSAVDISVSSHSSGSTNTSSSTDVQVNTTTQSDVQFNATNEEP